MRPCLFIIRRSCILCSINKTHCVSCTVAACHMFFTSKYVILIIYNHLLSVCTITPGPTTEPAFRIFGLFSQTLQLSTTSEQHQQTTDRPRGHQWTGTNHHSKWLLMELEQLPQTIKKGQKRHKQ